MTANLRGRRLTRLQSGSRGQKRQHLHDDADSSLIEIHGIGHGALHLHLTNATKYRAASPDYQPPMSEIGPQLQHDRLVRKRTHRSLRRNVRDGR